MRALFCHTYKDYGGIGSSTHLERVLGSDIRIKLLRTLFQEGFPILDAQALARETGRSRTGVLRVATDLVGAGALVATARGRVTFYSANVDFSLFDDLRQLFRDEREKSKVPHLFPTYWNHLESVVAAIAQSATVNAVVLYGSLTRPPVYPSADVDLLVVSDAHKSVRSPEGDIMGHKVSVLAMPPDSVDDRVRANDAFLTSALERHVLLYRAPDYQAPWTRRKFEPAPSRRVRRRGGPRPA